MSCLQMALNLSAAKSMLLSKLSAGYCLADTVEPLQVARRALTLQSTFHGFLPISGVAEPAPVNAGQESDGRGGSECCQVYWVCGCRHY